MRMKKGLRITIALFIVICLLAHAGISFAAKSLTELNKEKDKNKQETQQTQKELDEVKKDISNTMAEVESLINEISKYESEIDDLDDNISSIEASIEDAEEKIEEKEEELEEKQELLDKRLVSIYKQGDASYLDILLGSDSIVDFISKYYLVEELANNDTRLIDGVKETKEKIEDSKKQLEDDKKEVEALKKKQEAKKNSLDVLKVDKERKAQNLTGEQKQLESKLEELATENRSLDKKIKAAQEAIKNAKNKHMASGGASASGFIAPVDGYKVTTKLYYSSGGYHGAVDFSGSGILGKPVYAVADGYVVTTKALNYSYGNYVLIAHYNGLYTLYAHGKSGSIKVKEGQTVKQGQQIMNVGSTGNSTGPHLHFEVRTGGGSYSERVNPLKYLPSYVQ